MMPSAFIIKNLVIKCNGFFDATFLVMFYYNLSFCLVYFEFLAEILLFDC